MRPVDENDVVQSAPPEELKEAMRANNTVSNMQPNAEARIAEDLRENFDLPD